MDIYLAETRGNGLAVYRDRSRSVDGAHPIVGFLGPPAAIRDALHEATDPMIISEWFILAPETRDRRPVEGVPFALCYEITPQAMAGTDPSVLWVPIEYDELLAIIADGPPPEGSGSQGG